MLNLYPLSRSSNRNFVRELQRNFDDLLLWQNSNFLLPHTLAPQAQQIETEEAFILKLDTPGIKEEDIEITVEKDTISIAAQRNDNIPEAYTLLRQERPEFSLSYRETLPQGINNLEVSASLKDGVLEITLPKQESIKPKVIQVNATKTKEQ